jgi:hypothetical protein
MTVTEVVTFGSWWGRAIWLSNLDIAARNGCTPGAAPSSGLGPASPATPSCRCPWSARPLRARSQPTVLFDHTREYGGGSAAASAGTNNNNKMAEYASAILRACAGPRAGGPRLAYGCAAFALPRDAERLHKMVDMGPRRRAPERQSAGAGIAAASHGTVAGGPPGGGGTGAGSPPGTDLRVITDAVLRRRRYVIGHGPAPTLHAQSHPPSVGVFL